MPLDTPTAVLATLTLPERSRLLEGYQQAVAMADVNWLKKTAARPGLTTDDRRFLANQAMPDGNRFLFSIHAVETGNDELLGFLLREGANPDDAMLHAVTSSNSSAVGRLCQAKANANGLIDTIPYLNFSAYTGDHVSCRHLLDAGANLNGHPVGQKGHTALYDCMVGYEMLVSTSHNSGRPLEVQRLMPALQTMALLLQRGINAHQKEPGGHSAYDFACAMVQLAGPEIDPNRPDPWRRPLDMIQSWQPAPAAAAEMENLMTRLRLGKPAGAGGPA